MKKSSLTDKLTLQNKLIACMLIGIIVPIVVMALFINHNATTSLQNRAFAQLESLNEVKTKRVDDYIESIRDVLFAFTNSATIKTAMIDLSYSFESLTSYFREEEVAVFEFQLKQYYDTEFKTDYGMAIANGNINSAELLPTNPASIISQAWHLASRDPESAAEMTTVYDNPYFRAYQEYTGFITTFAERMEYYDVLLVDPQGNIVYSINKKVDFATNLLTGPFKESNAAKAFNAIIANQNLTSDTSEFVDFELYFPNNNLPASFIAAPMLNQNNSLMGVVIFEIPTSSLNNLLAEKTGLGETGKSFIVGADKYMRTQSRFDTTNSVLKNREDTEAVRNALAGKKSSGLYKNEYQVDILTAYQPVKINNVVWAVMTQIDADEALAAIASLRLTILINAGLGILFVIALAIYLARNVNKQLGGDPMYIVRRASYIAQGNLVEPLAPVMQGKKLVGAFASMMKMQEKLKTVISSAIDSAHEVTNTASEIAKGNADLSTRTEQQAASLEQTAASMEQMTSIVKQNANNANQANQLARTARDQAEKSGAVVGNAVSAMNEINESSKQIADIIGVIDEIAFQTNLLALNAAVEAARAGEQGRGFAVVASEVRNLAGRSATAAKEIKELINTSVKKIESGADLVNQSGVTLEEIVISVKKVSDIIAEIAASSQEQSTGIDQVTRSVTHMDEITQQNAALVQQAAAASTSMGTIAENLNEELEFFKVYRDDEQPEIRQSQFKAPPTTQIVMPDYYHSAAQSNISASKSGHATDKTLAPKELLVQHQAKNADVGAWQEF